EVNERTRALRDTNAWLQDEIGRRVEAEGRLELEKKRLESLVHYSSLAIVELDDRHRIITCNRLFEDLFQHGSEEIKGKDLDAVISGSEFREEAAGYTERTMGGVAIHGSGRRFRKDGTAIDVEFFGVPVIIEGKVVGAYGIYRDVSERKKADEEKEKMQARLEDARKMEAVATLAGGIAHQFNNALASISLNLDLLQMNAGEGKDTSGMVKHMRVSTQRMAQLTSQLLAYAQGGKYQVRVLSLSDLVRETLPSVSHTLEPAVHIDTDLPPDVQAVEADLVQMQMVLSAILSNASEAIEGEGHVRISTRNEYLDEETAGACPDIGPGRYVSLTIEDNGKGMDEETRGRVFEPFFTTKFQGRGLGMPAVYGIVRNHGGCVLVESMIGKGTTVRVYLPAVEPAKVKPGIRRAEPSRGAGTILLVEDEEMIMEVSRALLEKLGYRVLAAENGKEAVRIATSLEESIDLAVLDVILPDMAGKEVYRCLLEARPGLKVIVCSGYSQEGPAQEILDAGAQGFLQKPFSLDVLMEKLREVMKEGG
ncbi:MAG: response regulator, partial [Deltaproteobacteria bacterium]|nr:response regulator [Deltaproteobacteria bacterium]